MEERGDASVGVPRHPLSALQVSSTGVGGISATKLLLMATMVNVDAEGGDSVTSGGATLSMVVNVNSLGEAEFRRGRWDVIVFRILFRFRMTPLDTSIADSTGRGVSGEVEAIADDMIM